MTEQTPDRSRVGTNSVTVEHPGTHEPTKEQIDQALEAEGLAGFEVVSGEYVSGGPSTINVQPAQAEELTEVDVMPQVDNKRTAKKAAAPEGEQA